MVIIDRLQNSSYYWGFCAFVSYFVNHPLYTPPAFGSVQVYAGLAGFIVSAFGYAHFGGCIY